MVGPPKGEDEEKEAATIVQGKDVKQGQANEEEEGNPNT